MTTSKVSSNAKKMQLPVESLVSKLSPEGVARYIPHDKSICAVFRLLIQYDLHLLFPLHPRPDSDQGSHGKLSAPIPAMICGFVFTRIQLRLHPRPLSSFVTF